eukprot:79543-Rhodomonas_salina.2
MSGTNIAYAAGLSRSLVGSSHTRSATLSAYACPMPCPVLTYLSVVGTTLSASVGIQSPMLYLAQDPHEMGGDQSVTGREGEGEGEGEGEWVEFRIQPTMRCLILTYRTVLSATRCPVLSGRMVLPGGERAGTELRRNSPRLHGNVRLAPVRPAGPVYIGGRHVPAAVEPRAAGQGPYRATSLLRRVRVGCYALSSTDTAYAATRRGWYCRTRARVMSAICLRTRCATPGTNVAYAAIHCPVLTYTMSGTEAAHRATAGAGDGEGGARAT